jgi:hypothetical protein
VIFEVKRKNWAKLDSERSMKVRFFEDAFLPDSCHSKERSDEEFAVLVFYS